LIIPHFESTNSQYAAAKLSLFVIIFYKIRSFSQKMIITISLSFPLHPFAFTDAPLWFYWCFPSILQAFSFDCTERFLRFYWNGEPSTLTRRAFAIATPSARYRNAEPSATSWIQRSGSVSPQMRFWQSPEALQSIHTCDAVNQRCRWSKSI